MKKLKTYLTIVLLVLCSFTANATYLLIPMDMEQENHLKAYGIAYYAVAHQVDMSWLLNYRGGSFMCVYNSSIEDECVIRGVSYQVIADIQAQSILEEQIHILRKRRHWKQTLLLLRPPPHGRSSPHGRQMPHDHVQGLDRLEGDAGQTPRKCIV